MGVTERLRRGELGQGRGDLAGSIPWSGGRCVAPPVHPTEGDHHVATACTDDRGHDPGRAGRGDPAIVRSGGPAADCVLPARAGPAQRGGRAPLPAGSAPARGGARHVPDRAIRAAFFYCIFFVGSGSCRSNKEYRRGSAAEALAGEISGGCSAAAAISTGRSRGSAKPPGEVTAVARPEGRGRG